MSDLFSFVSCQILPTKLISKAHVGFFCLSRVKFYAQNLKRRQFFWNFWIQCVVSSFTKELILSSRVWFVFVCLVSNFTHKVNLERTCRIFLFVSCQILRAKSQSHASNSHVKLSKALFSTWHAEFKSFKKITDAWDFVRKIWHEANKQNSDSEIEINVLHKIWHEKKNQIRHVRLRFCT